MLKEFLRNMSSWKDAVVEQLRSLDWECEGFTDSVPETAFMVIPFMNNSWFLDGFYYLRHA